MTAVETSAELAAQTTDGEARQIALEGLPASLVAGPEDGDTVAYASSGRALIIGPEPAAVAAAERLRDALDVYVVVTDNAGEDIASPDVGTLGPRVLRARRGTTQGHLGAFQATVIGRGGETDLGPRFGLASRECFDLLLDLDTPAGLQQEKAPPGYFAPADPAALERALTEMPELVGEFEKPRYFDYRAELCAHGHRGQTGCTRCIEACATGAIRSAGELIEVDPYLCQGCGSCATVCPSGAIGYAWPSAETLVDGLRGLLRRFRDGGGRRPTLLFHDGEAGAAALAAWAPALPESALPVAVEDVGSLGPDALLAALAFGAGAVQLLVPPATPASERAATAAQIGHARDILRGLGYPDGRIGTLEPGDGPGAIVTAEPLTAEPATFAGQGGKREVLRHALRHFHSDAPKPAELQPLAADAPYGAVEVDADACTLCMACVSVCPPSALIGGGEEPQLLFREDRCVQCGLCAPTCPEGAITLVPRMNYTAHVEPGQRVLHEEAMHHCPGCGTAFATRKLIARMEERLAGHWMFQDESARQRLYLCEDCRIRAAMSDEHGINPYR